MLTCLKFVMFVSSLWEFSEMLYKQSWLMASGMSYISLSFFSQFEWFWFLCKACNFFYEAWQICNHLSNKRVLVFPLNCCVWCWCSRSGFWSYEWVLGSLLHSWSFFWLLLCSNSTGGIRALGGSQQCHFQNPRLRNSPLVVISHFGRWKWEHSLFIKD